MSKNKLPKVKRALRINFNDGASIDLDIQKATTVKTSKSMINFDKLDDGSWRLIYDENLIPDFSKIVNFEMVREGDVAPKVEPKPVVKSVDLQQLDTLNPYYVAELTIQINNCTTIDEVITVITKSKGIYGTYYLHTVENIIENINKVVKKETIPQMITRSCGLREKVMRLSNYDEQLIKNLCTYH
jgi:hypothetical protein